MLSNTATPRYYGLYRDKVLRGEIHVPETISLEMNRIDRLIACPDFYYDDKAVEGWIRFCEEELTLPDGSDQHMLETFKVWGEEIFGWYYFVERDVFQPDGHGGGQTVRKITKNRLVNLQYLIIGRGAAKTVYLSDIQAYYLAVDTSTTHQITTSPTIRQSDEVLSTIRTSLARSKGPLFAFLTEGSLQNTTGSKANRKKMSPTKNGIENFITNSLLEPKPMSIQKLQGLRTKVATVDEWLSCDIREDPIGAIAQGSSKIDDWIIVAASSEGTIRNGPGDDIKMELMSILRGDYVNPHVSIWWYKLDDLSEVGIPEMWQKANPNLGYTVQYETYQLEVERAEKAPATRNDTLAKRFGWPTEGYTYFFSYEETIPTGSDLNFDGMPCFMGGDLSQGDDFCTFLFLFPISGQRLGIKTINYITTRTYERLPVSLREKYDEFIREGSLRVMEGTTLQINDIYDDVDVYITRHNFSMLGFGYDPYNADKFVDRWCLENGPYGVVKVIQGARTETVPLGEIKKLMEDRMILFDQQIMKFALGNAITVEDTNGNRKLLKMRRDRKIDPVSALVDAYVAYLNSQEV